MSRSSSSIDRLTAQAGVVAARKNSGGASPVGLGELDEMVWEALGQHDGGGRGSYALASMYFQAGNSAFSRSRWDEAEQAYDRAIALVDEGSLAAARLTVDALKGLGGHRDDRDERLRVAAVVTDLFELLTERSLGQLGRVGLAKSLQFAGDACRRAAVPNGNLDGSPLRRPTQAASYFYGRAYAEYAEQELTWEWR